MILVTGGAGFIGSNVVKELNNQGHTDILIVDDLTDGRKFNNLVGLSFSDYMDVDDFLSRIKDDFSYINFDKIFHIGGISSTTEMDGKKVMHYNHHFTCVLHLLATYYNTPFVFTSSASVYGNSQTFIETETSNPLNLYALSKDLSERFINKTLTKDTFIFRPFNVYGENENHKDDQASPVSKFAKQYAETGSVKVFEGSENIKRDFIWVGDVANILVNHTNESNGGTYNLGTGQAVSFYDVAKTIVSDVSEIKVIPFPSHLLNKYQYYSCADLSKLRTLIGEDFTFKTITTS